MAGDEKNVGAVAIDDGIDPLAPLTGALLKATDIAKASLEYNASVNSQILRLDAGAAPVPLSQHIRYRVRGVIVNPVTAGILTLTLGTSTYPFASPANGLTYIPFPLLIERGTDMSCVGADGRIYLIGDPE